MRVDHQGSWLIDTHFHACAVGWKLGTVRVSIIVQHHCACGCHIIIDTGHVYTVGRSVSPVQVLVDPVVSQTFSCDVTENVLLHGCVQYLHTPQR